MLRVVNGKIVSDQDADIPCDNCMTCAAIGRCKMRRKMVSVGNPACHAAADAWVETSKVCSECGVGVYNGHHFADLPTSTPCIGWTTVTLAAYRAAH